MQLSRQKSPWFLGLPTISTRCNYNSTKPDDDTLLESHEFSDLWVSFWPGCRTRNHDLNFSFWKTPRSKFHAILKATGTWPISTSARNRCELLTIIQTDRHLIRWTFIAFNEVHQNAPLLIAINIQILITWSFSFTYFELKRIIV